MRSRTEPLQRPSIDLPAMYVAVGKGTREPDKVKARIAALGLRPSVLAAATGLRKQQITAILKGDNRTVSDQYLISETVRRLSGRRDVTVEYLFGEMLSRV